jgi:hypothetical protein
MVERASDKSKYAMRFNSKLLKDIDEVNELGSKVLEVIGGNKELGYECLLIRKEGYLLNWSIHLVESLSAGVFSTEGFPGILDETDEKALKLKWGQREMSLIIDDETILDLKNGKEYKIKNINNIMVGTGKTKDGDNIIIGFTNNRTSNIERLILDEYLESENLDRALIKRVTDAIMDRLNAIVTGGHGSIKYIKGLSDNKIFVLDTNSVGTTHLKEYDIVERNDIDFSKDSNYIKRFNELED